ncbi:MAG: sigma-54 interaction domain-containing protein [Flavobacteriia bacterium]|jgi:transcriptional regulator with PAS, ATPase and Fis domain
MKTLISWYDKSDFIEGKVNPEGPVISFHAHFYKHERHVILSARKDENSDTAGAHLSHYLRKTFPERVIEFHYLDIQDPIDHREIQAKVHPLLASLKEDAIDIFVSPGTPAMQVVWYLAHMSLNLNTTLYQTRPARFTTKKDRPELIKIQMERSNLGMTALYHQEEIKRPSGTDYFTTSTIEKIYDNARKVAQTDEVTVLVLGASGTGKENLAKHIHFNSVRAEKPYIAINCSAFSDTLLESRLFGYKKGAYTGADKDSIGLFEQAHEGTIFLDEIGDISPYMQQSLLRVLQEKEIMPLGGKAKKVDVRVIAATNQNLVKRCEEGYFRWDLYYRLSVVELDLPTLMQRGKKDIKEMIDHFLTQKKKQLRKSKKLTIDKSAMDVLLNYSYPGNIRELENIISRLYVFNEEKVTLEVLPKRLQQEPMNQPLNIEFVEKEHIKKVLKHFEGNRSQTAVAIGWAYNTLMAKMQKYGLSEGNE